MIFIAIFLLNIIHCSPIVTQTGFGPHFISGARGCYAICNVLLETSEDMLFKFGIERSFAKNPNKIGIREFLVTCKGIGLIGRFFKEIYIDRSDMDDVKIDDVFRIGQSKAGILLINQAGGNIDILSEMGVAFQHMAWGSGSTPFSSPYKILDISLSSLYIVFGVQKHFYKNVMAGIKISVFYGLSSAVVKYRVRIHGPPSQILDDDGESHMFLKRPCLSLSVFHAYRIIDLLDLYINLEIYDSITNGLLHKPLMKSYCNLSKSLSFVIVV
ncbi:MAG: hypothetical protein KAH32_04080 [Chlamydiia bacterium]|nr:hypothetical protein [Chlamydiia bacterium]